MKKVITLLSVIVALCAFAPAHTPCVSHPIGDDSYAEVYSFIGLILKQSNAGSHMLTEQEMKAFCELEVQTIKDNDKPHIADMCEGEDAGLLRLILLKNSCYQEVTLYGKNGVGIATSGIKDDDVVLNGRPLGLDIGVLTSDIISGPKFYTYQHNHAVYNEYILPIYENEGRGYPDYYTDISQNQSGTLVGYASYIAKE